MSGIKRLARHVLLLIAFVLAGYGLLEVVLQVWMQVNPTFIFGAIAPDRAFDWEQAFLDEHEAGREPFFPDLHEVHPTRGWTTKKNVSAVVQERQYTLNERGYRSTMPHREDGDRYRVLVLGNSFTFGIGVDDAEAWPAILQSRNALLDVLNLGVAGYGIDQMCITGWETLDLYKPDLTILAFIEDNLFRSLLSFRDSKKPRFVVSGDALTLTNTPIDTLDETYLEIRNRRRTAAKWGALASFVMLETWNVVRAELSREKDTRLLNTMLIQRLRDSATEMRSDFLVVHLAHLDIIQRDQWTVDGEAFLRELGADGEIQTLETRDAFMAKGLAPDGHYTGSEAAVVADRADLRIQNLDSYKLWLARARDADFRPVSLR